MSWNQVPTFPGSRQSRYDGDYVNLMNRYGTMQDNSTAYEFKSEGSVPDMTLTEHYEANGLFSKVIDIPAEEMVKHGFSLGVDGTDTESYILDELERLEWEENASAACKWARLYGGALGVMLIDDGRGIDEPLDYENIKHIEEIRVFERAVVCPDYSSLYDINHQNPLQSATPKFGMPEYYQVNSVYCQFWVHESRCLIFRNGILPERTMQPCYRFWGLPEYLKIHRELREVITAHSIGVKMLDRSVQAIYKMKDLASLLATDEGHDALLKRLQAIDMARGILNSVAIDNEGEDWDFKTIPFSGVKDVIETTCNMLSAVTNIPQTILFGASPNGMNATGESDLESWYNYIERGRKLMLKSNLTNLVDIICKAGRSKAKLEEQPNFKIEFNPLWSMSETELATAEREKTQTAQIKAQTAQMYIEMGVLTPTEIRKGLAQEEEYDIETLLGLEEFEDEDLWGNRESYDLNIKNTADEAKKNRENQLNHLTADVSCDRMKLINSPSNTDEDEEWITVNGTPIKVENGKLQGAVGEKIETESEIKNFGSGFKGNSGAKHHQKRQREGHYKDLTEAQYQAKALALLEQKVGGNIDGFETKRGDVVRWDKTTNDYAVGKPNEKVRSMFPLRGGQQRFDKLRERDGKEESTNE